MAKGTESSTLLLNKDGRIDEARRAWGVVTIPLETYHGEGGECRCGGELFISLPLVVLCKLRGRICHKG
jgi:hypothetical protein